MNISKRAKAFSFICLMLIYSLTSAHINFPKDSINRELKSIKGDSLKVIFLIKTYDRFAKEFPGESEKLLQNAIERAEKAALKYGLAEAYYRDAKLKRKKDNYQEAFEKFHQSLELFNAIGYEDSVAHIYKSLAYISQDLGKYDEALNYANTGIEISKRGNNKYQLASIYNTIGENYRYQAEFDSALRYYNLSLKVCDELKDSAAKSAPYMNMGIVYSMRGDYQKALKYFNYDLKLSQNKQNDILLAHKIHNIAVTYAFQGNYPKSMEMFFECLALREKIGNKKKIAATYTNIGELYNLQKNYDHSLVYFKKAFEIYSDLGDKFGISECHYYFGRNYYYTGQYDKAEASYQKAIEMKEEMGDKLGVLGCYSDLGSILVNKEKYTEAKTMYLKILELSEGMGSDPTKYYTYQALGKVYLALNDVQKAIKYSTEAYDWAERVKERPVKRDAAKVLSDSYSATGNYKKALDFYKTYKTESDSLLNAENIEKITSYEYQFKFEKEKQAQQLEMQKQEAIHQEVLKRQKVKNYAYIGGIALLILLSLFIFRSYRIKQSANRKLRLLNEEILQQKEEISAQRDHLGDLNEELETKNQEIAQQRDQVLKQKEDLTASITYAQLIQKAVLPEEEVISSVLKEHFILFKPRDIVSGDFYWFRQIKNHAVIVAADCTGHGVPGAFMSMLGISILNELVSKSRFDHAGEMLDRLRNKVKQSLKQSMYKGESKDGMDIAMCILDTEFNMVQFAGAYNPLIIVRNNETSPEIIEVKGDRQPIAIHINEQPFKTTEVQLQKGDSLYVFSDGYIDQFGGSKGKKFKLKRFKELLLDINEHPMNKQKEILDKTLEDWMSTNGLDGKPHEQVDDILVIGIKV